MERPVTIMFHSAGLNEFRWSYPHIAEPPGYFERKMAALARAGYTTQFFASNSVDLADGPKQVILTFDDGYLDNWVHVFPILKKYGQRATVFVTPEFVDPRDILRQHTEPGTVKDVDHDAEQCCAGFLSWSELREMEASGLVDIQCHALTHTWYFNGPKIVDFWHPGAATEAMGPIWLLWNRLPHLKPYYLTQAADHEAQIPFGTPIYEHGKALETKQFFPDPGLDEALPQYVREHGEIRFFRTADWRSRLIEFIDRFPNSSAGRFETDAEYDQRVRRELSESKGILEKNLGKTVEAICWPGGGVNDRVLEIAREVGYRYFTLPSRWRIARGKGQYSDLVPRIASRGRHWWGRAMGRPTPREFIWDIESARNSKRHKLLSYAATTTRWGWSFLKPAKD